MMKKHCGGGGRVRAASHREELVFLSRLEPLRGEQGAAQERLGGGALAPYRHAQPRSAMLRRKQYVGPPKF